MFCKYCGFTIDDDSVFCPSCGKKIISVSKRDPSEIELKKEGNDGSDVLPVSELKAENTPVRVEEESKPADPGIANKSMNQGTDNTESWYYQDGEEVNGPFPSDVIVAKILNKSIDYDAKVRKDSDELWVPLALSPFRDAAKKAGGGSVTISDRWIWCLAVVPLALLFVSVYFGWLASDSVFNWLLPFALNTGLFFLDRKELLDKGFLSEGWIWLGIFLIPVYLIVREVKTNHNFVPVILWCFLEAVIQFAL